MREKQKILVVEDQEVNRRILAKILQEDYAILEAANGEEAIAVLKAQSGRVSGVLLDIIMPVMDGYQVLKEIHNLGYDNIPVIAMTGEKDPQTEEKTLLLGAWDFVPKPYQAKVLKTRLANAIARSELNLLRKIKHMAEHDAVTELYNRRHFFEITQQFTREHQDEPLVFIKMDVNRFKLFNTFYGEEGGDRLLKFIGTTLEQKLMQYKDCTYGRIEADEFGFCIPYEKEQCDELLNSLVKELSKYESELLVEPKFGVYVIEDNNMTAEAMFIKASMASKRCKDKYMVYIGYYDSTMEDQLLKEQEIMGDMEEALKNEDFLVYFQPKYNVQTKMPYGAEALVRWKHPQKGMISPGAFIPFFEKNGFIAKLDYYIWEKVCIYLRKWLDEGIHPAPISVNMSRLDVSNPNLVEILENLIKKYQVPAKLFNIELTESAYMDNPEYIKHMLDRLHAAGFTILMDDFGSGYSSLNTLKDFEVDILKIDMKFLPMDSHESKSKKILTSVIRMAGWLKLPVIVEGVENREQNAFLESIGCEYIQGYYYAKPMPAEEYEKLIRDVEPIEAELNDDYSGGFFTNKLPDSVKDKVYRDPVTGIYNRRYFNEWLFLDIDDGQNTNQKLGIIDIQFNVSSEVAITMEKREQMLSGVADILNKMIRKNDSVIRYSDEEFIVVLMGCTENVVQNKVNDLKKSLETNAKLEEIRDEVSTSIGYSYTDEFVKNKDYLYGMIYKATL